QTVLGLGALSASSDAPSVVTISDPVAGVSYVLEPNARRARQAGFGQVMVKMNERRAAEHPADAPPPPPPPPPPGEARLRGRGNVANMPEPLGTRQIEGLSAVGTKRTE